MGLKSIHIHSYRGIRDLSLGALQPINVFTGKNDSGKTSLLEIVSTLQAPLAERTWMNITRTGRSNLPPYEGIIDLFHTGSADCGYTATDSLGNEISVKTHYSTETPLISQELYNSLSGRTMMGKQGERIPASLSVRMLTFSAAGRRSFSSPEEKMEFSIFDFQHFFTMPPVEQGQLFLHTEYLSPLMHLEENEYLQTFIEQEDSKQSLLHELREMDEHIEDIAVSITNENSEYAKRLYKVRAQGEYLPLSVYGDGIRKALLLMSAVLYCRGGLLLVDEFETSLHTVSLPKVVRWLLHACKRNNVQLFLTTHSKDSMEAIFSQDNDLLDDIALYTLIKTEERTIARTFAGQEAVRARDVLGLELR